MSLRGMENLNIKRTRNKKWTAEEKELLQKLISKSSSILANRSTKPYISNAKINEWKNITTEFNRLLSKSEAEERSVTELKLAWRRLKRSTKENVLGYRRRSPNKSCDQPIPVAEAPFEVTVNVNYDDSTEVPVEAEMDGDTPPYEQEIKRSPSEINLYEQNGSPSTEYTTEELFEESDNQIIEQNKMMYNNMMNNFIHSIVNNNEDFKKKHMEILEKEHQYNIEIAKLKVKKLQLEIALLTRENGKKTNGSTYST